MKVISTRKPNPHLIEMLETLLAQARDGSMYGFMYLAEYAGVDEVAIGWTPSKDYFRLAGSAARLQHRIQLRMDDNIT